jgi:hypothetical protein
VQGAHRHAALAEEVHMPVLDARHQQIVCRLDRAGEIRQDHVQTSLHSISLTGNDAERRCDRGVVRAGSQPMSKPSRLDPHDGMMNDMSAAANRRRRTAGCGLVRRTTRLQFQEGVCRIGISLYRSAAARGARAV